MYNMLPKNVQQWKRQALENTSLVFEEVISKPNKAWVCYTTYIKLKDSFVYFCVTIDWHTRAILSYKLSNSIDTKLVVAPLKKRVAVYGKLDIFNTDKDSQYTSDFILKLM